MADEFLPDRRGERTKVLCGVESDLFAEAEFPCAVGVWHADFSRISSLPRGLQDISAKLAADEHTFASTRLKAHHICLLDVSGCERISRSGKLQSQRATTEQVPHTIPMSPLPRRATPDLPAGPQNGFEFSNSATNYDSMSIEELELELKRLDAQIGEAEQAA